jgi:hypothetical protein
MAKTEEKSLKKRKGEALAHAAAEEAWEEAEEGRLNPFRDASFYIAPTAPLRSSDEGWGLERASDKKKMRVEDMIMDVAGDDHSSVIKKKSMMKWDKKKKKFVKVFEGEKQGNALKKVRNEAGVLVKKRREGELSMYQQWQARTKKRVPAAGEVEEGTEGESVARTLGFQRYRHGSGNAMAAVGTSATAPGKDELKSAGAPSPSAHSARARTHAHGHARTRARATRTPHPVTLPLPFVQLARPLPTHRCQHSHTCAACSLSHWEPHWPLALALLREPTAAVL